MNHTIDIETLRAEFPYLEESVRGRPIIYLDSAASSQKPRRVIRRMADFMTSEYANVHRGIHLLSERATDAFEGARRAVADFIGAASENEIVFTRGTTEAVNLVANTWGRENIRAGDLMAVTAMEHHSNLLPWIELARRQGAEVAWVPVLENGSALDLAGLQSILARGPKLLACVHVPNTLGLENPVRKICAMAAAAGVVTLVDGAQSVGHQPVNVQEIGCDFLAFSAHKMCGPTGIGALYGRSAILKSMPPWHYGGEMVDRAFTDRPSIYREPPARFEAGTPAIIEAAGWHAALEFLKEVGPPAIQAHSITLAQRAADGLRALPGVRVVGPERRAAGIAVFAVEGVHAQDLAFFANERGVALRAGHHCAQPLMRELNNPSSARISTYLYNTEEEIDRAVEVVAEAIRFFA